MNAQVNTLAPVAMFVYNRLSVTRQTIEHLQRNELALQTPLYVFSDGGKDEESWKKVHELRQYLSVLFGTRTKIRSVKNGRVPRSLENVNEGNRRTSDDYFDPASYFTWPNEAEA